MSADIAHRPQPLCNGGTPCAIVAEDRKLGNSTQALVDIVIEGQKGAFFDAPLSVVVQTDDGKSTEYSFAVGYFENSQMVRSVIVSHNCGGFEIEAKWGSSTRRARFDLTCGD